MHSPVSSLVTVRPAPPSCCVCLQAKELQSRLICCEAELAGRAEVEAAQQREIDKLQR